VPPDAQHVILAAWGSLQEWIVQNSTDSSRTPSSDPSGLKRNPPHSPSERNCGGQPGRHNACRMLVPPTRPPRLQALVLSLLCPRPPRRGPQPLVHQISELPRIEPIVDESHWHLLRCPRCGATTCGARSGDVPTGRQLPPEPADDLGDVGGRAPASAPGLAVGDGNQAGHRLHHRWSALRPGRPGLAGGQRRPGVGSDRFSS
jgi:hypothetical protein